MTKFLGMLLMSLCFQVVYGQSFSTESEYPEDGKLCPNFQLTGIKDYTVSSANIKDFRGKWLLLDFWDKHCLSCIEALPKVNEQLKKYKDRLQYILVGREDKEKKIYTLYSNLKKELGLNIPYLYDTTLFRQFDILACPTIVVINPEGVVYKYISSPSDRQLEAMMAGQSVAFFKTPRLHGRVDSSGNLSALKDNDERLIFRSQLVKSGLNFNFNAGFSAEFLLRNGKFETCAATLFNLYMLAYFGQFTIGGSKDTLYGKIFSHPIIETSGQTILSKDSIDDIRYCYSLVLPQKSNKNIAMHIMRNDLKNYFGYDVSIEEREFPCWKLTSSESSRRKLATQGGTPYLNGGMDGFVARNYPIKEFLSLFTMFNNSLRKIPIIDETGIKGGIDIQFKHPYFTEEEVKKGLEENGLSLKKDHIKMKVLILHNVTNSPNDHIITENQDILSASNIQAK
ncbi:redoxin domain-containing protein [Chitinophaga sp. 212800010-3]|uniref:redoxin domain-containing protein n=1 Tax=unclassified Chitinophaga TaxID=2619133 RepID=UPI002DEF9C8F|nr:hypothetical protein [Chitinophaga sp. 212800010-3]